MAQAMQLSVDYVKEFKTDVLNAPVVVGASGAVSVYCWRME
jgi:hypothetical protein